MSGPLEDVLYPFQRDGVRECLQIIARHGGAVLADAVGLGKSFTALGVASGLRRPVVVVCPAALRPQWRALLDRFDCPGEVRSHASLVVSPPVATEADSLVVVDEAHRFRNPATKRYRGLIRCVGCRPVLFLTATPIQNTRRDLLALFRIFVAEDWLRRRTGLGWQALEERADETVAAVAAVAADLVVARARVDAPVVAGSRRRVVRELAPRDYPRGAPLAWARSASRAVFLEGEPAALFERTWLRRLASSPEAADATLARCRNYLVRVEEARGAGGWISRHEFRSTFGLIVDHQIAQGVLPFWYGADDGRDIGVREVRQRIDWVDGIRSSVGRRRLQTTRKWQQLRDIVDNRRGPLLVFTEHAETAERLFEVAPRAWGAVLITGQRSRLAGVGVLSRERALEVFRCGDRALTRPCRVLIATDVAGEGLNLQHATGVVHFDLPWNPARMEQRVGRVDRIGGPALVDVWRFQPCPCVEAALGAVERLAAKRARWRLDSVEEGDLTGARSSSLPSQTPARTVVDGWWRWLERVEASGASDEDVRWALEVAHPVLTSSLGLARDAAREAILSVQPAAGRPQQWRHVVATIQSWGAPSPLPVAASHAASTPSAQARRSRVAARSRSRGTPW